MRERLDQLDGLRAIAALSVIVFHYCNHWLGALPYGVLLRPIAGYGYLGVNLFFVISGFVISMTLERTSTMSDFAWKRAIRLVPPMLVCAILTFLFMRTIDSSFTEAHRPDWADFFPSLTFTAPELWHWLLPAATYMDGSYWTLFVELRFYILAACAYYLLGPSRFVKSFLGLIIFASVVEYFSDHRLFETIGYIVIPRYLPMFAAGAAFYELYMGRKSGLVILLLTMSICLSLYYAGGYMPRFFMIAVFAAFLALLFRPKAVRWLAAPWLAWIGLISYPLYLLHENIGIAVLSLLPERFMSNWFYLATFATALVMIALAGLVHEWVEKPAHAILRKRPKPQAVTA